MVIKSLRWFAVLPTGLVAVVIIMFPMHWLVLFGTTFFGDDIGIWMIEPRTLERLAQGFVVTSGIIYFGAVMAPGHKFMTAIVLSVIVAVGLVAGYIWVLNDPKVAFDYSGLGWISLGALIVLQWTGIGAGLWWAKQTEAQEA